MERRGEGARLLQTALFRTDGKVYRFDAKAGEPLRDPARIRRLFSERFMAIGDECDPGFGYDMIRLSALTVERLDPVQAGLARDDHRVELAHLVDRLSARFGAARVTRLSPRDTHIPEFAEASVPAQMVQENVAVQSIEQDSLAPARPIRLFARPEVIEALAEVPDGPPVRVQVALYHPRYCRRRRPRTHRHAMVARRCRPRADARLFPGREPAGHARLALSRRPLRQRDAQSEMVSARSVCVSIEYVRLCRTGGDQ